MIKKGYKWLREHYFLIVNSIAFYPIIIAICFLILSMLLIEFDFSDFGRNFKTNADWLSIKDAATSRTIIATIAGGILSLAVFSFSMVMILLNQAAVNMSNRILDNMIGNRFHQLILGSYIGTIVYSFFLLSTIRDVDSGLQIPSISIYALIIFAIVDIFLFIYFLHYITQSVKYETIINRLHTITYGSMVNNFTDKPPNPHKETGNPKTTLNADKTGYISGFAEKDLIKLCEQENITIQFLYPLGHYVLAGTNVLEVSSANPLNTDIQKRIISAVDLFENQNSVTEIPYLGCQHLSEVAIKALSPGINDPGTAILSLNRLCDLLAYRISHYPCNTVTDTSSNIRLYLKEYSFEEYFTATIYPIWRYGKNDLMLKAAMLDILLQMEHIYMNSDGNEVVSNLIKEIEQQHD